MQKMRLESFDEEAQHLPHPPEGYDKGFAEGYAEGIAAAKSEQSALQQELVQSIADLEFKYEEVRGELIRSLGPLFTALSERVFPHLIEEGLADQIAHVLLQAAIADPAAQFNLSVHPSQHQSVATALETAQLNVTLGSDPALTRNAAWVRYSQSAQYVDFDQMLADIRLILSTVNFIETRTEKHG